MSLVQPSVPGMFPCPRRAAHHARHPPMPSPFHASPCATSLPHPPLITTPITRAPALARPVAQLIFQQPLPQPRCIAPEPAVAVALSANPAHHRRAPALAQPLFERRRAAAAAANALPNALSSFIRPNGVLASQAQLRYRGRRAVCTSVRPEHISLAPASPADKLRSKDARVTSPASPTFAQIICTPALPRSPCCHNCTRRLPRWTGSQLLPDCLLTIPNHRPK